MFNRNTKKRKSMKKITLLALLCAMFMAPSVLKAQEVTYVEDPAQGYTFNRFQDNWFIEGEGGAGVMFSQLDHQAKFGDRIGWKANLALGKWFSPLIGVRFGGEINKMKGVAADASAIGYRSDGDVYERTDRAQNFNNIGGFGDVLFNLTNWICGYKPGRFYNAIVYGGASVHWVYEREGHSNKGDWKYNPNKDQGEHSRNLSVRAGLLNTFALSKHVNLLLDLRFDELQEHVDGMGVKTWIEYPSALLGLSYKFNKTEWKAPIVPVCPTYKYTDAEGDALVARLQAADAKIANLEQQLRDCLNKKPAPAQVAAAEGPLATIYYPIGKSYITPVQKKVVSAVANVMKDNNSKNYVLTGWADNYTGTDKINAKLRKDRVGGVKKALVAKGVEASRLDAQINDGNLTNYGAKCASLDRAVTINEAK
jgi:outer membrane protein OmpA-like peptidoglycan-associated protein